MAKENYKIEEVEKGGCPDNTGQKDVSKEGLKKDHPDLFKTLCDMEQDTLNRLKNMKNRSWYDEKRPLKEAIEHRYPATYERQICLYC